MLATMAFHQMTEERLVTASQFRRFASLCICGLACVNCHAILFLVLSKVCGRSAPISCSAAIEEAEDESIVVLGEMVDDNVLKCVDFTLRKYCRLIFHDAAVADVIHEAEDVNALGFKCGYLLLKIREKSVQGISVFILQDNYVRLSPSEFFYALLDICKSLLSRAA